MIKDIKLIKGVRRRTTKLVHGIEHWKYERLEYLGLTRLERRRIRSDLIETFKIMKGKYDICRELCFQLDTGGRRGHELKLFKRRFRLDIRKFAELLITGIHYLHIALIIVALLTLSKNTSRSN